MEHFATCNDVARALRALRASAGDPSFGQIAATIGRVRAERGVPITVAAPGRTTVYDAFRDGRRRIDAALVGEIVQALGMDETEALQWEDACRRVGRIAEVPAASELELPVPRVSMSRLVQIPKPPRRRKVLVAVLVGCVLVNLFGRLLVVGLHLPLHLDMVGTAIGAIVLGPWWGALVGAVTNVAGVSVSGWPSAPFALVNVAGALLWGYGVRARWGETLSGYFALNVAVAVVCSMIATPILVLLFGGELGHGSDTTTDRIMAYTHNMALSVFPSNVLTSLADKLISGFVALVVVEAVASRRRD